MGKVKTWQKVTIALLSLALVAVIAVIITRNNDTKLMQDQAGYTEQSQTQVADYDTKDLAYTKDENNVATAPEAAVSAEDIAKELYKQFEKNYGTVYKNSGKNEFYNPHYDVKGDGVQIVPFHVWYEDGKMYADCYVVNMNSNYVDQISVDNLELYNDAGKIAQGSFGELEGVALGPGQYVTQCFVFSNGSFKKADISHVLNSKFDTVCHNY